VVQEGTGAQCGGGCLDEPVGGGTQLFPRGWPERDLGVRGRRPRVDCPGGGRVLVGGDRVIFGSAGEERADRSGVAVHWAVATLSRIRQARSADADSDCCRVWAVARRSVREAITSGVATAMLS
jgi:hypothetical protein